MEAGKLVGGMHDELGLRPASWGGLPTASKVTLAGVTCITPGNFG